jgi:hypothetical protein
MAALGDEQSAAPRLIQAMVLSMGFLSLAAEGRSISARASLPTRPVPVADARDEGADEYCERDTEQNLSCRKQRRHKVDDHKKTSARPGCVYNAEGRTKFRLEGRCAAQTGSGSPRNSVVAGPFTAMIAIPITPAAYEAIKRMSPKTNAGSLGADGLVRIWLDRSEGRGSAGPASRRWRELYRGHSAAGEGQVMAGRPCAPF